MEQENPRDERPAWVGALMVASGAVGALLAVTAEGADRIWGLLALALFGGGGLAMIAPKDSSQPGVTVERAEHRGGRWSLSFSFDRRRYVIRVAATLTMAVAGLLMAIYADDLAASSTGRRSPVFLRVAGVFTVVTFGGFGVTALAHRRRTPRMLLLEEGIEFEAQGGGRTFVPWDAITRVSVVSLYRTEMIGVSVDDRDRIETGPVAGSFRRFNRSIAGADVTFPVDAFVAPPKVVVDAVRRFVDDPEQRRRLGTGEVNVSELLQVGGGTGYG